MASSISHGTRLGLMRDGSANIHRAYAKGGRNVTKLLTVQQYARHRGCSVSGVMSAINSGKIARAATMEKPADGKPRWMIDPVRADELWRQHTSPYGPRM